MSKNFGPTLLIKWLVERFNSKFDQKYRTKVCPSFFWIFRKLMNYVTFAPHYNPRSTIWRSFMYCDLWPYVWLVIKSSYSGVSTVFSFEMGKIQNHSKLLFLKLWFDRQKISFTNSETRNLPNVFVKLSLFIYSCVLWM